MEACQAGEITDQELEAAKQALYTSIRAAQDSPGAIESYYSTAALSGLDLSLQDYMAAVQAVTKEQVVEAAKLLTLHSTYFLKGEEKA